MVLGLAAQVQSCVLIMTIEVAVVFDQVSAVITAAWYAGRAFRRSYQASR